MTDDTHGFPWGSGAPGKRARILFSLAVGLLAAAMHYFRPGADGGLSDFSIVWYGADVLVHGGNPYAVIGPGRAIDIPSNVYYPAPALALVMPFLILPVELAGAAFVFLSAVLLAYGMTVDGWYRVPMLVSVPFFTAARLGQWSILMTAALFLPALAAVAIAKPQTSLPVLASSTSRRTWIFAVLGAAVLLIASFALMPSWPAEWKDQLQSAEYFRAPILSIFGALIAVVLARWRRPEAWIVFASACLPQTWYPYNALILLAVAWTYREACVLSLVASIGWLAAYYFAPGDSRSPETQALFRNVLIGCCYLPASIVVLRRPNVGPSPVWIRSIVERTTRSPRARMVGS